MLFFDGDRFEGRFRVAVLVTDASDRMGRMMKERGLIDPPPYLRLAACGKQDGSLAIEGNAVGNAIMVEIKRDLMSYGAARHSAGERVALVCSIGFQVSVIVE